MILAIFDLDDTLTLQDTESLWQEYLVNKGLIERHIFLEKRHFFEKEYHAGRLNFDQVISFSLMPIASLSHQEQTALQQDFAENYLNKFIIPQARTLVQSHYDRGHHVIILSAGHDFLVEPAAAYFPAHTILCSQIARASCGKYLPFINGLPLYRAQKMHALLHWLRKNNLSPLTSYFYSDSINDLPLLEHVQIPIAVSPCQALEKIANARNWPILDLKKEYLAQTALRSY